MHDGRVFRGFFAHFDFLDATSCKWHVPCCGESTDTGTSNTVEGSQAESQGKGLRGGRRPEHGRPMCRSAPPSAHRAARVPRAGFRNRFFRVTWSPGGSYPVPSCVGSRERGESNSSRRTQQCGAVPVHSSSQKTKYARSTKPGEQWGSSRSLPVLSGRGSQKVERSTGSAAFSISPKGFAVDTRARRNLDCPAL